MSQPTGDNGTTTPTGGQDTQSNSDSTAPAGEPNTTQAKPSNASFTQADLDKIVEQRLIRERAKYADYDQVKERAAQWDKFVEESKPEQEKALNAAKKEAEDAAYAKARTEFGGKLVQAHLQAAAAGRLSEGAVTALVAGVDTSRFLTEAGDVDTAKVTSFIDGIAPPVNGAAATTRPGSFGQGQREGAPKAGLEAGAALWEQRHAKGQAPPLFT
jgi:nucleotide-binding universal stress UspA family protein